MKALVIVKTDGSFAALVTVPHGCTVNLRIAAPSREISMRFIVTDGQLVVTSSHPDKGGGRILTFRITAFTCGKIYICKE